MANLLSNAIKRTIGKREALFDVSALNPYVHEWKIKVKIIRKFRRSYPSYETMDLILVDVKGQKIHAVIGKEFIGRLTNKMKEGTWISLTGFALSRVTGPFRPTNHRFMIHWKSTTYFRKIMPLITDDFYSFATFGDIKSGSLDTDYCVDLIGRVCSVGNRKEEGPPDYEWNELFFDLKNTDGDRLSCRLPKPYANDFFNNWRQCGDVVIICVIRFAKLEVDEESWRATAVHGCTSLLLNPPCARVYQMKADFEDMEDENS